MSLYLLYILKGCFAGFVCLENDWVLEWTFASEDLVKFDLKLTSKTLSKFQWVAVGFKYPDDTIINTDIVKIVIGEDPVDAYARCDCAPETDISLNGEDNIIQPVYDEAEMKYSWIKPVNALEEYDKFYRKDSEMKVIWASGKIIRGIMMKHMVPDRGSTYIVLSEDFAKDCITSL